MPQENPGAGQGSPDEDNVVYACTSRRIVRTLDISVDNPVWEDITPPGIGTIYDCTPDPPTPRLGMWALASSGIWRTYRLAGDTPTWQRVQTYGQIRSSCPISRPYRIRGNPGQPGTFFVLLDCTRPGGGDLSAYVARTHDWGMTWAWAYVGLYWFLSGMGGFEVVGAPTGREAVVWATSAGAYSYPRPPSRQVLNCSVDGGHTFSQVTRFTTSTIRAVYVPYDVPQTIYVGTETGVGGAFVKRSGDNGATWEDIAPTEADG